ncbi:MAG: hypothetical protein LKF41_06370 [Bifidobacterium sp.]|jgi:hypothetical protein|nr:hypothetical protein [Bifidobacterium sp.]MCH4175470.1 hypothetical protein [Bifidobacterium sp.]
MNTFVLQTDEGAYADDEITSALFQNLLDRLYRNDIDFMVLQPNQPIQESSYLQVLGAFAVEIRMLVADGSFIQYSYISDNKDEVLSIFLDYWERGELPDLNHWKDITGSLTKPTSLSIVTKIRKLLRAKRVPSQVPIDDTALDKS